MSRAHRSGFTLIEILVVIVIVAIMAVTVVVSFAGTDRNKIMETEARRLAVLLELTRQQAVQRNEEWGVFVDFTEYSFANFDAVNAEWVPYEQRPMRGGTITNATLRLEADDQYEMPGVSDQDDVPDLVFFSSGESQAFTIRLEPDGEGKVWLIESDGLSRVVAEQEER